MALINLKTTLKDLKFGNDQKGYGSSGLPYVQTPIPGSENFNFSGLLYPVYGVYGTGGPDYPLRGGAPSFTLGLQTISKFNDIDEYRIKKFLESNPKGSLFIQKQIGLQLSNPKTEVATTGTGPGEFGPLEITRVYQSANTLRQVQNQGTGVHGRRHGLNAFSTFQNDYFNTVNKQNIVNPEQGKLENRLLNLYSVKMYNSVNPLSLPNSFINLEKIFNTGIEQNLKDVLFRYTGGPGSVYGIGETIIRRSVDTTNLGKSIFSHIGKKVMTYDLIRSQTINESTKESSKQRKFERSRIQDFRDQAYGASGTYKNDYVPWQEWEIPGEPPGVQSKRVGSNSNETYENLKRRGYEKLATRGYSAFPTRFAAGKNGFDPEDFRENPRWTKSDSIESKFYAPGSDISGVYRTKYDKLNASYPFTFDNKSEPWNASETAANNSKDLIKFVFEAISNDDPSKSTAIFFRAFLKGAISDNNTGQWNGFNYFGRGEKFYTYQGFERTIGFSFSVPIFSRAELEPVYNRLNALMSQVYPDYSTFGLMRAPILRVTIGDYLYRVAGFLENVNLNLAQEAAWEIEDGTQLPMMVEVQTSFKPIPEDLPRRYREDSVPRLIIQRPNSLIETSGRSINSAFTTGTDALKVSTMYSGSVPAPVNQEIEQTVPGDLLAPSNPQKSYYEKSGLVEETPLFTDPTQNRSITLDRTPLGVQTA